MALKRRVTNSDTCSSDSSVYMLEVAVDIITGTNTDMLVFAILLSAR